MKKALLASLFILCVGVAHAQDNPYAIFGYKVKTILKDNPEELLNVQNTDKSSKIKSFTFDPIKKYVWLKDENGKIVGSVPVKPTDIKRFLSQDRFSEKYYQMNPYHYAANNPIMNIDMNGDSVQYNVANSTTAMPKIESVINNGLGGFYTANTGKNGRVTLNATSQTGTMTSGQQNFYDIMSKMISDPKTTSVNVVESSQNVLIGDINSATIDIDDIKMFGSGPIVNEQGALVHETREQYEVQVQGSSQGMAHFRATSAENRVLGIGTSYLRPSNSAGTQVIVPYTHPQTGLPKSVYINYSNNNVTSIIR